MKTYVIKHMGQAAYPQHLRVSSCKFPVLLIGFLQLKLKFLALDTAFLQLYVGQPYHLTANKKQANQSTQNT